MTQHAIRTNDDLKGKVRFGLVSSIAVTQPSPENTAIVQEGWNNIPPRPSCVSAIRPGACPLLLIAPDYATYCMHYPGVLDRATWAGFERTLEDLGRVGNSDVGLVKLNKRLPVTVAPATFLAEDWLDWLFPENWDEGGTGLRIPTIFYANRGTFVNTLTGATDNAVSFTANGDAPWKSLSSEPIDGDSGSPGAINDGGKLAFVGQLFGSGGPNYSQLLDKLEEMTGQKMRRHTFKRTRTVEFAGSILQGVVIQ